MCEGVGKMIANSSALCIKVSSDPVTFLITMLIFRFSGRKNPFDLFLI